MNRSFFYLVTLSLPVATAAILLLAQKPLPKSPVHPPHRTIENYYWPITDNYPHHRAIENGYPLRYPGAGSQSHINAPWIRPGSPRVDFPGVPSNPYSNPAASPFYPFPPGYGLAAHNPSPSAFPKLLGVREEWVQVYEGVEIPGSSRAIGLAVDGQDHIYVSGYSPNLPNGMDFYTIGYDAAGNELWAAYFDGEGHGDDIAGSIAVDGFGNIYVGGESAGVAGGADLAVVKYNPAGQQQWVYRYGGSPQGDALFGGMAADSSGNIYFTGLTAGSSYATLKLNAAGSEEWITEYAVSGYPLPPQGIAIDVAGNVYLVGEIRESLSIAASEFLLLKYSPEGVLQWEARYKRTDVSFNSPTAMAVNDSGEVYLTGVNNAGYDDAFLTVKYERDGNLQWVETYDSVGNDVPYGLVLDTLGNIYVSGVSGNIYGRYDCLTLKYNSAGQQLWEARYTGEAGISAPSGLSLSDGTGTIYVAGSMKTENAGIDWFILKYNSAGILQWSGQYDGPGHSDDFPAALAIDSQRRLIITGESSDMDDGYQYTTAQYHPGGVRQWESHWRGKNIQRGEAIDLALDYQGNIYALGTDNRNVLIVKYNPEGSLQWADTLFKGTPVAMEADAQGNTCTIAYHNNDIATIKYNSAGVRQWIAHYDGPPLAYGASYDVPVALALDRQGNAYVLGGSSNEYGWGDFVTLKYTPNGQLEWLARYEGGEQFSDIPRGLAVDFHGNVYVTGDRQRPQGAGYMDDLAVIKYNSRGEQIWMAHFDQGNDEHALSIGVDGWGNVYVNGKYGHFDAGSYSETLVTIKYAPSGEQRWVARYHEPGHIFGWTSQMKIDALGNPCISGFIWNTVNLNQDYFIIKYDTDGREQWIARYDAAGSWDRVADLALDREGNIYVVGEAHYAGSGFDLTAIKYNRNGETSWIYRHAGSGNTWDAGKALEVDASGNVYLAGYTASPSFWWSYFKILKLSQTGVDSLGALQIGSYELEQNFPNPFNNQTLVWYRLPAPSRVAFRIYNSLGEKISEEDLGRQEAGRYPFYFRSDNLASGIYFYQMKVNDAIKTRKMVVVR